MEILSGLNERQQEAVTATDGPVLVLAGAGSGKTKTLVHRIAYLLKEKQVRAERILAVTFTNKAAGEMKDRVAALLRMPNRMIPRFGNVLDDTFFPVMGTFHSISVRILRKEAGLLGYKTEFVIYDSADQKATVKRAMENLNISSKDFNPQTMLWMISDAKNKLVGSAQYAQEADGFVAEILAKVYAEYQDILRKHHAMDFDDLIMNVVRIFLMYPDALKKYQDRFEYILVDEYQDINEAQYRWVSLLAQKYQNIFVVGDDWQAIYGWRGANYKNILNFENDYPDAKVILLEQNYRSTQQILDLGNAVIKQNHGQKDKQLWTAHTGGILPCVVEVGNERDEGEYMLCAIAGKSNRSSNFDDVVYSSELTYDFDDGRTVAGMSILDKVMARQKRFHQEKERHHIPTFEISLDGVDLSRYVVLYRTNAQSRALEEVLLTYGVPYRIVGGMKFYDRKEIKDMLAMLRFLHNHSDLISFDRAVDVIGNGIGAKTIMNVRKEAERRGLDIVVVMKNVREMTDLTGSRAEAVCRFGELMEDMLIKLDKHCLDEFIDMLGKQSGYFDSLKDGSPEGDARLENIQELKSVATKFKDYKGKEGLFLFLEEVALLTDIDQTEDKGSKLTLMTLHSAKGLEFQTVFIVGCEEGLLPHTNSIMDPEKLEEERRLCYVGITRARERLYMIHTRERTIFGKTMLNMPSQFIMDLPDGVVKRIIL